MDYTNLEKYKNWLKNNLNEERYEHSLGTAECASELAQKYGLDKNRAYFCGLIHDCAKCFSKEELETIMCKCSGLCEGELDNPKTYHAPAGAMVAKEEFCVEDEEILSAIRWHTLGYCGMSEFDKIIFLADKIEPNTRPTEYRKVLLDILKEEKGLDKALFRCFSETIKSLVERKLSICQITIDVYNELLNCVKPANCIK